MAKKKIDEPFFLTLINLPFDEIVEIDNNILPQNGKPRVYVDEEDMLKDLNEQAEFLDKLRRPLIINAIKERLKARGLPDKNKAWLSEMLRLIQGENCDAEYDKICNFHMHFSNAVLLLMMNPAGEAGMPFSDFLPTSPIRFAKPVLQWKPGGKLEIILSPDKDYSIWDSTRFQIDDTLYGRLSVEFAQFLVDHYKPGIFTLCNLEECEKIIITTNGRKYCSTSHREKASLEKKKNDSRYAEWKRIRDKLRQRYNRHPNHTMDKEEFIKKYWDADKRHLYCPPPYDPPK